MFDDGYHAEELPHLLEQLQKIRSVTMFLKQRRLTRQLLHGVCQELAMVKFVLTQYSEVENLRIQKVMYSWKTSIRLMEVVQFLEPFKESSKKLEQGRAASPCVDVLYGAEETPCCCVNRFSRTVQAQVENAGVSSEKIDHRRASQNHNLFVATFPPSPHAW